MATFPVLRHALAVQQGMDITMSVRLRNEFEWVVGIDDEFGIVVFQRWHTLSLFDQRDLLGLQSVALILLQELFGCLFGVVGDHDAKRKELLLFGALVLNGLDVLAVVLDVRCSCGDLGWKTDLGAAVAQSLSQSTSNQDEAAAAEFLDSNLFRFRVLLGSKFECFAAWDAWLPILQRIFTGLACVQQLLRLLDVLLQTTRIRCIQLFQLRCHASHSFSDIFLVAAITFHHGIHPFFKQVALSR
mmetsp:Transcript_26974/g.75867  ORF Transcript_26974/g.75867 Transcript_26974/m.75867 type:complete len:244 (+) Transcript_26974:108-839(+)